MNKNKPPEQLLRGNKFHKKIQENWKKTAEGKVTSNREDQTFKNQFTSSKLVETLIFKKEHFPYLLKNLSVR